MIDTLLDRSIVLGYSRLGYGLRSRSWSAADPRRDALAGKTAVVTGARSGLGKATAAGLARLGATVHVVVRSAAKAADAVADLRSEVPGGEFVVDECDVSDLDAVRRYVDKVTDRIDVLVHNAGVMPPQRTESAQGHELTLATHVLGPLLLTELLRPQLANGRVILVASGGMYTQRLPADLEYRETPYKGAVAYARSKRVQVALTPLLATHLPELTVATMHPGWSATPGLTDSLPLFTKLTQPVLRTPEQGIDTTLWLAATHPAPPSGHFWHDRAIRPTHYLNRTRDTAAERRRTWEYCRAALAL
ncbi:SDR family NAD(P)-dependent oxidoreductase [Kribbella sandramycini]|uniref:NAD(P)-dependent dehydrogenase (Short-subunit alcohol dehydrogenase family) n=1 Tax=Kribbella sandramycini TaxID=60450 RepID=A0A7Y4P3C5_9ACTN|nr:SDR family NAD(P)-dependent oxidoreductase [Kribbella sandramycini]MBB6570883.1 NAD(P)-dependent dehydrogenase (short-subunit alcohol dehydrogenase family) [Kribbella sandramycini]NOL44014.1 SDR family NAD(P)-dependent oxidoreductase [Kribbella sandramycini]